MENRTLVLRKLLDETIDNNKYYERTFLRYMIVSSATAIVFILTFYKESIENVDSILSFDVPLWLFSLALISSVGTVYIREQFSAKYSTIVTEYLMMITELDEFKNGELVKSEEVQSLQEKHETLKNKFKKARLFDKRLSRLSFWLGIIPFSIAFFWSLYLVTNYV